MGRPSIKTMDRCDAAGSKGRLRLSSLRAPGRRRFCAVSRDYWRSRPERRAPRLDSAPLGTAIEARRSQQAERQADGFGCAQGRAHRGIRVRREPPAEAARFETNRPSTARSGLAGVFLSDRQAGVSSSLPRRGHPRPGRVDRAGHRRCRVRMEVLRMPPARPEFQSGRQTSDGTFGNAGKTVADRGPFLGSRAGARMGGRVAAPRRPRFFQEFPVRVPTRNVRTSAARTGRKVNKAASSVASPASPVGRRELSAAPMAT